MLIEQSKANETETGCVAVVLSVFFAILLLYNRTSQSSNASARDSQSTVFTIITNLDFIHPLANLFCIGWDWQGWASPQFCAVCAVQEMYDTMLLLSLSLVGWWFALSATSWPDIHSVALPGSVYCTISCRSFPSAGNVRLGTSSSSCAVCCPTGPFAWRFVCFVSFRSSECGWFDGWATLWEPGTCEPDEREVLVVVVFPAP